jgi:hypothetical protein
VQYLLAMGHRRFVAVLAAAAVAEVAVLVAVGADLTGIAVALFALQASCAVFMLADAFRTSAPS